MSYLFNLGNQALKNRFWQYSKYNDQQRAMKRESELEIDNASELSNNDNKKMEDISIINSINFTKPSCNLLDKNTTAKSQNIQPGAIQSPGLTENRTETVKHVCPEHNTETELPETDSPDEIILKELAKIHTTTTQTTIRKKTKQTNKMHTITKHANRKQTTSKQKNEKQCNRNQSTIKQTNGKPNTNTNKKKFNPNPNSNPNPTSSDKDIINQDQELLNDLPEDIPSNITISRNQTVIDKINEDSLNFTFHQSIKKPKNPKESQVLTQNEVSQKGVNIEGMDALKFMDTAQKKNPENKKV